MNHKRGKARSARAGCKMCKPWKKNGMYRTEDKEGEAFSDHKRREAARIELEEGYDVYRTYWGERINISEEVEFYFD